MVVTRKALKLDVIELMEDLPEDGLKRGERGAVVEAFDDASEAYDLEYLDESGQSQVRLFCEAYSEIQSRGVYEIALDALFRKLSTPNARSRVRSRGSH